MVSENQLNLSQYLVCQGHAVGRSYLVNHSSILHSMPIKLSYRSGFGLSNAAVLAYTVGLYNLKSNVAGDLFPVTPEQVTYVM